jgi:hypothetical protein
MNQDLWVKDIETPTLKSLCQWRDELYGFWMVYSDTKLVEGEKMVIVNTMVRIKKNYMRSTTSFAKQLMNQQ